MVELLARVAHAPQLLAGADVRGEREGEVDHLHLHVGRRGFGLHLTADAEGAVRARRQRALFHGVRGVVEDVLPLRQHEPHAVREARLEVELRHYVGYLERRVDGLGRVASAGEGHVHRLEGGLQFLQRGAGLQPVQRQGGAVVGRRLEREPGVTRGHLLRNALHRAVRADTDDRGRGFLGRGALREDPGAHSQGEQQCTHRPRGD